MPATTIRPLADISQFVQTEILTRLIDEIEGRQWSPWAVILVAFHDDPVSLPGTETIGRLFTARGDGEYNMVDFFSDMSHGKIDCSGTEIFGWYRLDVNRDVYVGNVYPQPSGKLNRDGLLGAAKAKARAEGVALDDYAGVVVCGYADTLVGTDLCGWVGGMAALCDMNSLEPSLLGQEMGHGYGLDHARRDGSTDDYRDPWDVMSTAAYPEMEEDNSDFTKIGPGLNAWNMRARGWLDETRVWRVSTATACDVTIDLRPLHRPDLPGVLAAELGEFLIEFRVAERWDAAIGRPCVLVHRFSDNHSYLMTGTGGHSDLVEGESFTSGRDNFGLTAFYELIVERLDAANHTATIRLRYRPRYQVPEVVGTPLGGVDVDGGGIIIIDGRVIRIPPRGPAQTLLREFARYIETDSPPGSDVGAIQAVQRDALASVVGSAALLYADAQAISESPPGYILPNAKDEATVDRQLAGSRVTRVDRPLARTSGESRTSEP